MAVFYIVSGLAIAVFSLRGLCANTKRLRYTFLSIARRTGDTMLYLSSGGRCVVSAVLPIPGGDNTPP